MVKLLANLRKVFSFNKKNVYTNLLRLFTNKQLVIFLSLCTVIFTNNSSASSWIPKNSLLIKNFDFHEKGLANRYSSSISMEERIPNSDCSLGLNLFKTTSMIMKKHINNTNFFYKCKIWDKKNKLITIYFPISISRHGRKTELIYGIAISNGSSKVIKKKIKNKLSPVSVFSDWRFDFIFSSNRNKKNIYKIQKTLGLSFKNIEFITMNAVDEYCYNETKINDVRTDIKIGIKIDQSLSLHFGLFKIIHFEKSKTHKSRQGSSGFGFGFSVQG